MEWLTDTSTFVPRTYYGDWPIWLAITAVICNIVIGIAYVTIPVFIYYYWKKKHETIPYAGILIGFILFIFFCGLSHFMDAILFFWPAYRLWVFADAITAFLSFATLIYMPRVTLYFLRFKTPGEYREIADALEKELQLERQMTGDIERIIRLLEIRITRIETEVRRKGWIDTQNLRLDELKEMLDELKGKQSEYAVNQGIPASSPAPTSPS